MTRHGPSVSVVIATYNTGPYLSLAVRSALEQSYRDIEVLIIDDGSTDDTAKIVRALLQDSRARYIFQENKGQAAAKNRGIQEARGRYVAFLDADDMWTPDKLALQLPLFSRTPALGVVYSRVAYIDQAGNDLRIAGNRLFRGRVSGPLLIRNFIGFGSSVVRKECFDRLGAFDEKLQMGIDYDLWLRLSTEFEFDFVDRPLLRYRVWPGQMSNNCKKRYLSGIAIMQNFLDRFPGAVAERIAKEAWAHTYVGFGDCLRQADGRAVPALRLYLRALRHRPSYLPAWRAIATTLVGLE